MFEGRPKIVLTRRWPEAVEQELAQFADVITNEADQPLSAAQLREALVKADIVCPTVTDPMPASLFANLSPKSLLLANFGVGFNHIDVQAAAEVGISVTNTPGVLTDATAEIALTLMLMSARRTGEGERQVRANQWQGWAPTHMLSSQVTGKTLGIVGMGRIGSALARKAHFGLDMQILYTNRSPVADAVAQPIGAQHVPLEELLARSDFVSLHCPSTPQTHHLIDASALAQMQPHAHLINTARGEVVDETALVTALQNKHIAGAGLDVYEAEPELASGLRALQQVVLLPHMGSGTVETREAMGRCALNNIKAYLAGEELPNLVLPS